MEAAVAALIALIEEALAECHDADLLDLIYKLLIGNKQ